MEKRKLISKQDFFLYGGLSGILVLALAGSLNTGYADIPFFQTVKDLWQGKQTDWAVIFWDIRVPRALLAILVGASLGLAGAAMQGFVRNPLAEPGILGVTGGGVLGAVVMIYTGIYAAFPLSLPVGGMIGAFVSVLLLYLLAGWTVRTHTLILAGIALNTLAFSCTSLILNLSKNPYAALEIVFWQMGSLADRSFDHVLLASPFILAGWVLLFWDARAMDALSLGEESAASLGISLNRVRFRLIFGTALAIGASVAVTGSIGFIGLVVPHLLRPLVKYEPGRLLGVSALGGAILLLVADMAVRWIPTLGELKVGVLTSLIGAPFFVLLLFNLRKKMI